MIKLLSNIETVGTFMLYPNLNLNKSFLLLIQQMRNTKGKHDSKYTEYFFRKIASVKFSATCLFTKTFIKCTTYMSRLPWVFSEAPLKVYGTPENNQDSLIYLVQQSDEHKHSEINTCLSHWTSRAMGVRNPCLLYSTASVKQSN